MKPYKGELTLRSTVRYSKCTPNEGGRRRERRGKVPLGWGGLGAACKRKEREQSRGLLGNKALQKTLPLGLNCLLTSGLLIAYTQRSVRLLCGSCHNNYN
jgi:hypothetical protein